jgi:hypothetical protein
MALPLKPQTLEKLMGGNARRLLGKPPATAAAP